MKILAIESSCDETSAAVVSGGNALSNIISSQHFHSKFGGVVPELASRAHLKAISYLIDESLDKAGLTMNDINALAVTSQPGLIGSLIVGSNFAKGLSLKYNLPIVPVNHIEGHIFSGNLQDSQLEFPYITLVVSGGHTAIFLVESYSEYTAMGLTKDDAAGEAFDKIAKLLGMPYPGGPHIDKNAKNGNPKAYNFPRSMMNSKDFNFSFSGIKTAIRYFIAKNFPDGIPDEVIPDLAASAQAAIVDVLVAKTVEAAAKTNVNHIVIAGGVSANSSLRSEMAAKASIEYINVIAPELQYCMDNAAMIGFIAEKKLEENDIKDYSDLTFRVNPNALRAKRK